MNPNLIHSVLLTMSVCPDPNLLDELLSSKTLKALGEVRQLKVDADKLSPQIDRLLADDSTPVEKLASTMSDLSCRRSILDARRLRRRDEVLGMAVKDIAKAATDAVAESQRARENVADAKRQFKSELVEMFGSKRKAAPVSDRNESAVLKSARSDQQLAFARASALQTLREHLDAVFVESQPNCQHVLADRKRRFFLDPDATLKDHSLKAACLFWPELAD